MQSASTRTQPHVLLVGGGFAGLAAVRALARAPVQITVVDRQNHHLFRPMLYQVATGLLSADEVAMPLRTAVRRHQNVDVLMGEVSGVDMAGRSVALDDSRLHYDYLILATGIEYNYFGHPDWSELAPSLITAFDALRVRERLLTAFEHAERLASVQADPADVDAWLTFVVVGGGPTGVELAGAIADLSQRSLKGEYRHIDPTKARVHLFEAGPRVLPAFSVPMGRKARKKLERMGVSVRTGTAVRDLTRESVTLSDGTALASCTKFWAAGVRAGPIAQWLGVGADHAGRIEVLEDFSVPGHPEVFVVGDAASIAAPSRYLWGKRCAPAPLPGLVQPAMQAGAYVGGVIARRVVGDVRPRPFVYLNKGTLAIIGQTYAVADLIILRLAGVAAWLLWLAVHVAYLSGFGNRLAVVAHWTSTVVSGHRHVRIFPNGLERPVPR